VRTAALQAGAVRRGPVDAALAALPVLEDLLPRLALADPTRTAVSLVSTARRDAAAAVRTAATAVALHDQRAAAVLVRLLPPGGSGEWWARRTAEQEAVLPELAEVAELIRIPELAVGPQDVDALGEVLPEGDLPVPEPPTVPAPERLGDSWRLVLPLPFAERGAVDLTRWGDDLVVTAGGVRRSVRLDALLRRCQVTGGKLVESGTATARLEVTFVPDPALWPADLLPAEGGAS
jgi:arsenite-transporting ATPase